MRRPLKCLLTAVLLCLVTATAAAECGCQGIVLRNAGRSGVYCATAAEPMPAACAAAAAGDCAANETPYTCPLGAIDPPAETGGAFGWGFEIVATLTAGSDADDCPEGQFNQLTQTENGASIPNPTALDAPAAGVYTFGGQSIAAVVEPTFLPRVGTTDGTGRQVMGSDLYNAPDIVKRHVNGGVRWVDTPTRGLSVDDNATESSVFLSFVNGSAGQPSCWCWFTIQRTWTGGQPGGPGLALVAGNSQSCVLQN